MKLRSHTAGHSWFPGFRLSPTLYEMITNQFTFQGHLCPAYAKRIKWDPVCLGALKEAPSTQQLATGQSSGRGCSYQLWDLMCFCLCSQSHRRRHPSEALQTTVWGFRMLCKWEVSGSQPLPHCTPHPGLTVTSFLQWHLWRSTQCGRMSKQLPISLILILLPNKILPNLMKKRNGSLSISESRAIINSLQFHFEIASTSALGHASPACSISFSGCPLESGCSSSHTLSALPPFLSTSWLPCFLLQSAHIWNKPFAFFSCFSH